MVGPRSGEGSLIVTANETVQVRPAHVDKVVDATGAGDLYAAGFLFGFTRNLKLADCGRLGSLAAAEVISHIGARPETSLKDLVRETTGTPSIGFHTMNLQGRSVGLPVPVGETVRLRFPAYTLTPRRLRFVTWGRPNQSAILRIAYPSATTFVITAANEYYPPLPPGPVTLPLPCATTGGTVGSRSLRFSVKVINPAPNTMNITPNHRSPSISSRR